MSVLTTWLLALLLLSGCATSYLDQDSDSDETGNAGSTQGAPRHHLSDIKSLPPKAPPKPPTPGSLLFHGNGMFVKPSPPSPSVSAVPKAGDITLNFEGTDVREVVKVVLSDLLGVNYILDPAVQGSVTMETGRPLTRDLLLPTLETLLRMNKAALVYKGGVYYVMPIASAMQGELTPQLGDTSQPLPNGYSMRIVPLKYIGATEMAKILKPLAPDGGIIRVDPVRNLLVLVGSSLILTNLLDTIETFDVNWIKGLSVGVFKIQHSDIKDVMKQIEGLISGKDDNPLAGMFRVVPIEAANSLLVVTHQPEYLDQVGDWIERFDQIGAGADSDAPTLHVYRVKHGDAASLSQILGQLFSDGKSQAGTTPARVAPGMQAGTIGSHGFGSSMNSRNSSFGSSSSATAGLGSTAGATGAATGTAGQTAAAVHLESGVSIVADTVNNSLLLRATAAQYRQIESALEKLDIMPLQVLVQATIVEISLTDSLKYGLQWFFHASQGGSTGKFTLDGDDKSGLTESIPGFNWSLVNSANQIQAVLSAFAGDGLVKILSSPSVMVLDNHTAKIQIGSSIPTLTQTQTTGTTIVNTDGTSTSGVSNAIQYQDIGVMLSVTPRVTPGGLVIMDVEQEVSDVAATLTTIGSPTISKREIQSTVAVKDGQVVVLGGLIKDSKSDTKNGMPGLYKSPVLGWLFGQTSKSSDRTELLVVLTPKILINDTDLERVNEDFRSQMRGLKGLKGLQGLQGGF